MFGEVVDQGSELTLYESCLGEGQLDEDTRVAQQIATINPKDVMRIFKVKKGATGEVIEGMTTEAEKEQGVLQAREEKLAEPLTQQSETKARAMSLEEERRRIEATKTVRHAVQKLLNIGALTEAEKATQLASLTVQVEATNRKLQAVEKQIAQIGSVDKEQIENVDKKYDHFKN